MTEVKIRGLREFRLKVAEADRDLVKGLRKAANRAALIVVSGARPMVPVGPAKGGHMASSIKVASTQKSTRVRVGGARFPYAGWLVWGGTINTHTSRPTSRARVVNGRYVYPAYEANSVLVEAVLREELEHIARAAGLDPL